MKRKQIKYENIHISYIKHSLPAEKIPATSLLTITTLACLSYRTVDTASESCEKNMRHQD